jgi:hypothetical protein
MANEKLDVMLGVRMTRQERQAAAIAATRLNVSIQDFVRELLRGSQLFKTELARVKRCLPAGQSLILSPEKYDELKKVGIPAKPERNPAGVRNMLRVKPRSLSWLLQDC